MKKYFYITLLDLDNVFKTQVISWLELYRAEEVCFTLVKAFPLSQIRHFKQHTQQIESIRILYKGDVKMLYLMPSENYIGAAINALTILFTTLQGRFVNSQILIQTRNNCLSRSLRILKVLFGKSLFTVFDCRAAGAEEYRYQQLQSQDTINPKYNRTIIDELKMLHTADITFFVSKALRNYYMALSPSLSERRFLIYPCNADSKLFYYSETSRNDVRRRLNIESRIVLCYSGGMALKWHKPKEVINVFNKFKEIDSRCFLLLLTNDTNIAIAEMNMAHINESDYHIASVNNQDICKYLNAADVGLLFRDNVPMNNVASPTKFAEYLMCGLPVLISNGVGDFSEFVTEHKVGYLCENMDHENIKSLLTELELQNTVANKQRIADTGRKYFSKQALLPEVVNVYKNWNTLPK